MSGCTSVFVTVLISKQDKLPVKSQRLDVMITVECLTMFEIGYFLQNTAQYTLHTILKKIVKLWILSEAEVVIVGVTFIVVNDITIYFFII